MTRILRDALALLQAAERRRLFVLMMLSAIAAIVQTLAILAVMPFVVLLANPDLLHTHDTVIRVYNFVGAESYTGFLTLFGIFGIVMVSVGNLFLALEYWLSHRFICLLEHRIENQVLRNILAQPYEQHVRQHSARLSDVVLSQVERVVEGVIESLIVLVSNLSMTVFIVLMLLVVSLETTLVTLAGLFIVYLVIFVLLRRSISAHGEALTELSGNVFTHVREMLDGIREIKARRAERFFSDRFGKSSHEIAMLSLRYGILSYLPHFLLETLIFTGLVGIALYFIISTGSGAASLSYIALYGIAIYRLVPALRAVFESVADIHHNADAVRVVRDQDRYLETVVPQEPIPPPAKSIAIKDVTYTYDGRNDSGVAAISLAIPAGTSICLFGPSGSGKTTLLNILAGLLYPQRGAVLTDNVALAPSTMDSWRSLVGYCPQSVFLFDDSIASNIAFGEPAEAIDTDRVRTVAGLARILGFVESELDQAFSTLIGEDGKTLSGGQQQRIGIARALYHDPALLLFDESFTGIDAPTRDAILDKVLALPGKTLVFSSHDPSIAKRCDRVAIVDRGRLVACDTYGALARQIGQQHLPKLNAS